MQGTLKHTFQGGFSPRAAGHREGRGQGHSTVEVARGLGPATGSCCRVVSLEGEKQVRRPSRRRLRAVSAQGWLQAPPLCPGGSASPLPITVFRKFRGEGSCPQLRATWRLTFRTLCSGTVSAPGWGGPGTCAPRGVPTSRSLWALYQARFSPPSSVLSLRPPLGAGGLARCHSEMVDVTRVGPTWGRSRQLLETEPRRWQGDRGRCSWRKKEAGVLGGQRGGHSSPSTDPGEL